MQTVLIRNPNALLVPGVQDLLERALKGVPYLAPGGLSSIAEDLMTYITHERFFMFIGIEDGKHKALALGNLPMNQLFPFPILSVAYSDGSKGLKKDMENKVLDFITSAGYTSFWGLNGSGHSDKAWLKAFENERVNAKLLGSAYIFEVK